MKTLRQIALDQIALQERIQKIGINLLTCGNCGSVLFHESKKEIVQCFCGTHADCDCPDYYYSGMENNEEFNPEQQPAVKALKPFNLTELKRLSTPTDRFLFDQADNATYRYILTRGAWILYDTDQMGNPTTSHRMSRINVHIIND